MTNKKIIPMIELDSRDFSKKVIFALEEAGAVNTQVPVLSDRKEMMENLFFLIMNSKQSQRKKCITCGAYHWHFVKEFELDKTKDNSMMCSSCGSFLVLLTLLKCDEEKIREWMTSNGEINPYDLVRDSLDNLIKKGEISIGQTEVHL